MNLLEELDRKALRLISGQEKPRTFICTKCGFDCGLAFRSSVNGLCLDCNPSDCSECHGSGTVFGEYEDITDETTSVSCRACGGTGKDR